METVQLKQQLKKQIVEFLNLINVKPEDIKDDEPFVWNRSRFGFY